MANKSVFYSLMVIMLAGLFSSCITNKQKKYLQDETRLTYKSVNFEEYRVRINDEITYYLLTTNQESQAIYNNRAGSSSSFAGTNSSSYRIYEDGTVFLPFAGQVKIVGLTVRETQNLLTEKYRKFVPDAEVRVALVNNFFYVLGDNGKGQFYMYKDDLNIYQALAMAGDVSSMGDKRNIKIIRKAVNGTDQVQTFDLRKASVVESEFYYVRPNDVIYIPTNSNSFFRVESFSSFVSMFVAPMSLLFMAISLF